MGIVVLMEDTAPIDMVNITSFTGYYTSQVVGLGISEPSTVGAHLAQNQDFLNLNSFPKFGNHLKVWSRRRNPPGT